MAAARLVMEAGRWARFARDEDESGRRRRELESRPVALRALRCERSAPLVSRAAVLRSHSYATRVVVDTSWLAGVHARLARFKASAAAPAGSRSPPLRHHRLHPPLPSSRAAQRCPAPPPPGASGTRPARACPRGARRPAGGAGGRAAALTSVSEACREYLPASPPPRSPRAQASPLAPQHPTHLVVYQRGAGVVHAGRKRVRRGQRAPAAASRRRSRRAS